MPPKRKCNQTEDYSKLTVAQLKALCKKRNIAATGKKQELVEILKNNDVGGKKVGLF